MTAILRVIDTAAELEVPLMFPRSASESPSDVPGPDGRVGRPLLDGAGAAISDFEDDGTPIREGISTDRQDRHEETVAASEQRIANYAYQRSYIEQYQAANPRPQTATEITAPSWSDRLKGSLVEVMSESLGVTSTPAWLGAGAAKYAEKAGSMTLTRVTGTKAYKGLPRDSLARAFRTRVFGPTAKDALKRARIARGFGRALSGLAVAVDGFESWQTYEDEPLVVRVPVTAARTEVSFAGGTGGLVAGGMAGAAAGSACGPAVVVCAPVGGVAGAAAGAAVGSGIARWLWDKSIGGWFS